MAVRPGILRKIRYDEISVCAHPAQAPARILLRKHLMADTEDTSMPEEKVPAQAPDVTEQLSALQKRLDGLEAEKATLQKRLDESLAVASLPPDARAYHDALPVGERAVFLGLAPGERADTIAKAADANAVVYKALDGTEYRRSVDPQTIALAKRCDDAERRFAKMEAERQEADYRQRADADLGHLTGTVDARAALLKSVDTITDPGVRNEVTAILKSRNDANATIYKQVGTASTTGGVADGVMPAGDKLDALVEKTRIEKNMTFEKAYDTVLLTQEGAALYADSLGLNGRAQP